MIRRLVFGQAVGQAALFAVLPVLTRLLSAEQFALYQAMLTGGVISSFLFTWRLEAIAPGSPDSETMEATVRDGHRRTISGAVVAIGLAALMAGVGLTGAAHILLGSTIYGILLGLQLLDNSRLVFTGQVKQLSIRNLLAGLMAAVLQVGTALILPDPMALIAAFGVGRLAAVWLTSRRIESRRPATAVRPMATTFAMPAAGALSALSSQVPVFALLALGSDAQAGQMAAALRVAGAPLSFIGGGLTQALQTGVSAHLRDNSTSLARVIRGFSLRVAPMSALAGVSVFVFGMFLTDVVLGPGWREASLLMLALAIPSAIQICASPLVSVLPMLGFNRSQLMLESFKVVLTGGAILAYSSQSTEQLAWALCLALVAGHAATLIAVVWVSLQRPRPSHLRSR